MKLLLLYFASDGIKIAAGDRVKLRVPRQTTAAARWVLRATALAASRSFGERQMEPFSLETQGQETTMRRGGRVTKDSLWSLSALVHAQPVGFVLGCCELARAPVLGRWSMDVAYDTRTGIAGCQMMES